MNSCLFPRKLLVEYTIRTADFAVLFLFDKGKNTVEVFPLTIQRRISTVRAEL